MQQRCEKKKRGNEAASLEGNLPADTSMATAGHNNRLRTRTQHRDCSNHSHIKKTALHFVFVPLRGKLFIHLGGRAE